MAKNHIGKPYVWAAAGPNTFDCSGLVVFSYAKAGITGLTTSPQVQFNAARLIPASRAVPGDLVFYHDSDGSVYHVGIYLAPGDTVAAIDTSRRRRPPDDLGPVLGDLRLVHALPDPSAQT